MLSAIRRELRKLADGMKIDIKEIEDIVTTQVLKREIIEGDEAKSAAIKVGKFYRKGTSLRTKKNKNNTVTSNPKQPEESVTEILLREAEDQQKSQREDC